MRALRSWLRVGWNGAAYVIIFAGLVTAALRLLIGQLAHHPEWVEAWASHAFGATVSIGHVHGGWQGLVPVIAGDEVRVRIGSTSGPEVLRFERAVFALDPLASLRARSFALGQFTLQGLNLGVLRHADGSFGVAGFPLTNPQFLRWLLRQRELHFADAAISLRDELSKFDSIKATGVDFVLHSDAQLSRIDGAAAMVDAVGAGLRFSLAFPHTANVMPYGTVAGKNLNLLTLARALHVTLPAAERLNGDGSIRWAKSGAHEFRLGFALDRIEVLAPHTPHPTDAQVFAFSGSLTRHATRTDLQVTQLTADATTTPIDWRLQFASAQPLVVQADRVPLTLLPLLGLWPSPALAEIASVATSRRPSGTLQNLRVGVSAAQPSELYTRGVLHNASWQSAAPWPGAHQVSADFALSSQGGVLRFAEHEFALDETRRLQVPLTISLPRGYVQWSREADANILVQGHLTAICDDLPCALRGEATLPRAGKPVVDIAAHFGSGELRHLIEIIPLQLLRPHGDEWLRHAFDGGLIKHGNLILKGPLAAFPFDNGEGVLHADFAVEGVALHYANGWPVADDVAGTVALDGRHLRGTLLAAKFFKSDLREAEFAIEDVFAKPSVLTVRGIIRASLADAVETLRESPLDQSLVSRLNDFSLSGDFDLMLDLRLGLAKGSEKVLLGSMEFDGNELRSTHLPIALRDLRGKLSFTRDDWYGDGLTATLGQDRVGLVVNGGIGDPNYDNEFRLTGTADAARVLDALQTYAPGVHEWLAVNDRLRAIRGELAWKAVLVSPHASATDAPPTQRVVFESSLQGLAVDLPWPFGKAALEQRPLRIETTLGAHETHDTMVEYGRQVRVAIRQTGGAAHAALTRLEAVFGEGPAPTLERDGIYLRGELATLPFSDWALLLKHGTPQNGELPMAFELAIGQLNTFGQQFEHVSLRGHRDPIAWRMTLASERAAGNITVPRDLDTAPLTLDLDRLWLNPLPHDDGARKVDPRALPNLAMACASFKYHTTDFGQASLATQRTPDGLKLQTLVFQSPAFQVQAEGAWSVQSDIHQSQFSIHLKGEELGGVLQHFGYDAKAIRGGQTTLDIEAMWPGTPGDFTLDRLDGSLNLRVQKGRLLDIEPGSGRLFGLLSLQSLPRRLSLDFADLFQKGYVFDRIEGWFELENGNAYTNSLLMEGPSSRVEITGRTGLAQKDYDQRATVTPALSKSIPIASALFGPAGIGVGAAIYLGQKVFKQIPDQLDKFLRKQYSITGPWDNPQVEKL